MAQVTRSCGVLDTSPAGDAEVVWLLREARVRVFVIATLVACLLHGLLLASGLSPILRLLAAASDETVPIDTEVILPIEVDSWLSDGELGARGASSRPSEAELAPATDEWGLSDAGVQDDEPSIDDFLDDEEEEPTDADAGAAVMEAGVELDAGIANIEHGDPYTEWDDETPRAAALDAGVEAGTVPAGDDAGAPTPPTPLEDPTIIAKGGAASFAPRHPNVEIYFATDKIRTHALGQEFSAMLLAFPEWQFVMAGTKLDPIRDFDHILLAGPQMRRPQYVTAVAHYNAPVGRIRAAVDRARRIGRPPGEWLTGHPFPVATVSGGHHVVAILSQKRLLVVHPASEKEQIEQLKSIKPFKPSGDVVIGLKIKKPWRAFIGVAGLKVPKSLKWMRLTLTPVPAGDQPAGGGYIIRAEAEDESEEAAREHAKELSDMLEVFRVPVEVPDWIPFASRFLGGQRLELIGKPQFQVVGNRIYVRSHASEKQVRFIIRWVKRQKDELSRQMAEKQARKESRGSDQRKGQGRPVGSGSGPATSPSATRTHSAPP